jgi:DNA-binding NtrC family response regulator
MRFVVLLVEDEPLIRLGAQRALENGRYVCLGADDVQSGLELVENHVMSAHVLVTDIRMEGPDGWDIALAARERRPELPVIYITAESPLDWSRRGVPNSVSLKKPIVSVQSLTRVTRLVKHAASTSARAYARASVELSEGRRFERSRESAGYTLPVMIQSGELGR